MTTTNATDQDAASMYQDLIGFLQSTRTDLRLEASKAVLQVVSDRNEVLKLIQHGVLLPLLRIVSDDSTASSASGSSSSSSPTAQHNALKAILYMTCNAEQMTNQCVEELLQHKAVPRLVELVLSINVKSQNDNSAAEIVNLALAILANLTRTEQGAVELVGKTLPDEAIPRIEIIQEDDDDDENNNKKQQATKTASSLLPTRPTLELLLDRFLNRQLILGTLPDYSSVSSVQWDTLSYDPYQHFAAILMNATQVEAGRKFVTRIPTTTDTTDDGNKTNSNDSASSSSSSVLQILLPQMQNPNPIRRRGISGMVRNCCLDTNAAWWLLNVVKIATPLLYPLAGPEELDWDEKQGMDPDLWLAGPDKEREIDGPTRLHAVESILLLCASGRKSRETLRLARTYVVLKYADMVEELESVSERINECVQYLRRDEEGTAEGSSDRMVDEETTRQRLKLLPSSQVGGRGNNNQGGGGGDYEDYDDVD